MKRFLIFVLTAVLLLSIAGCSDEMEITGVWEQEMEISILGVEENTSTASIARFTFREDGIGTQEQIILDGGYPEAVREFSWQLNGETLALDYGGNQQQTFTISIENSTLKMESPRGAFDLKKTE